MRMKNFFKNFLRVFRLRSKISPEAIDERGYNYFFDPKKTELIHNAKGNEFEIFLMCFKKYYQGKFICYSLLDLHSGIVFAESPLIENLISHTDEIYS